MQSISQEAQRLNLLFQYGVLDATAIISWADAAIVRIESPPDSLLELSIAPPGKTEDILSCLNLLSTGAEFWSALRSVIPRLRDFVASHPDRAESVANHLYHTAISVGDVP